MLCWRPEAKGGHNQVSGNIVSPPCCRGSLRVVVDGWLAGWLAFGGGGDYVTLLQLSPGWVLSVG